MNQYLLACKKQKQVSHPHPTSCCILTQTHTPTAARGEPVARFAMSDVDASVVASPPLEQARVDELLEMFNDVAPISRLMKMRHLGYNSGTRA